MASVGSWIALIIIVGGIAAKTTMAMIDRGPETLLLHWILDGYDQNARPAADPSQPVNVTIDIAYNQLLRLDEKDQLLYSSIWMRLYWTDNFMTWKPEEHGNTSVLYLFPERIWTPDITLYNRADQELHADAAEVFPVSVTHTGFVTMLVPLVMTSSCVIDVTLFPYDSQVCYLQYGSWTNDGLRLDLYPKNWEGDMSVFLDNGQWELKRFRAIREVAYYGCCPEPFPSVTFEMSFSRKPLYYFLHLLLPSIMITVTSVGAFLLPSESGEKVTLAITVLLADTVFLLIIADIMPTGSTRLPLLGILFLGQISLLVITTLCTVLVLNTNMRAHYSGDVPHWLRYLCFKVLAPLICQGSVVSADTLEKVIEREQSGPNKEQPAPCSPDKMPECYSEGLYPRRQNRAVRNLYSNPSITQTSTLTANGNHSNNAGDGNHGNQKVNGTHGNQDLGSPVYRPPGSGMAEVPPRTTVLLEEIAGILRCMKTREKPVKTRRERRNGFLLL